ncbi:MAG TPA: sulfotransferase [Solirubrobacterales bacterium]
MGQLRRELFLERNRDPARAALVLGSGRSGTTWLAEALARQHGSRLVFEPFHPVLGCFAGEARLFADPAESEAALAEAARRVLSGRVRGPYIDQVLLARLPRGRVVKDVHAANLLPWVRARQPAAPIVFVVRHPIATSLSRLRSDAFYGLGDYVATRAGRADAVRSPVAAWLPLYDRWRQHAEPLVRLVAEWCLENAYPLSREDDPGVALVFYESAVLDPEPELARLGEHCAGALGPVRRAPRGDAVRRPSATDWRGTAAEAVRAGSWERTLGRWCEEVDAALIDECLTVLAEFGLDRLYGPGPLPLAIAGPGS